MYNIHPEKFKYIMQGIRFRVYTDALRDVAKNMKI